jgi:CRISPR-associated protein Csb1
MPTTLTLKDLSDLVAGTGVAIRVRQRLQPAGGAGDKVFPPTYATGDRALKYAGETRRIDGADVPCVLLDSVASQANRMEEALQDAWERGVLDFPVIGVDFSGEEGLADLGVISALQAPHRIADAILRDSVEVGSDTLFRHTPQGKAYTDASPKNATAVYELCPTALVMGVWDSTGPKGGGGSKFARALSAEIVAIGASPGRKVSSRIDPLGIQANVPVYESAADKDDWTIIESEAARDKGKLKLFSRGGKSEGGKASAVNHSNIAPSVDEFAGGITFDHAVQTVVLSLAALRRLRCVTTLDGKPLVDRHKATSAAHTTLAALGIAAIVAARAAGYDLRSRCLLVPDGPLMIEAVRGDGSTTEFTVSLDDAARLLREASQAAAAAGLEWQREPLRLRPAPKLSALVRESRAKAAAGTATEA